MWIKFMITHGPGHQSKYEDYVYSRVDLNDKEVTKGIEDDSWDLLKPWMEDPIIRWEKLPSLPKNIRDSYIDKYRRKREYAEEMIKILNEEGE
jgi:hypothetical protein